MMMISKMMMILMMMIIAIIRRTSIMAMEVDVCVVTQATGREGIELARFEEEEELQPMNSVLGEGDE